FPDLSPPVVPCLPGHYVGPGMAQVSVGGLPVAVTGTVDLTLDPPQGALLNISNGTMLGTGTLGTAMANITGAVDCNALKLVNGMLVNGQATALGVMLPFTGTADA